MFALISYHEEHARGSSGRSHATALPLGDDRKPIPLAELVEAPSLAALVSEVAGSGTDLIAAPGILRHALRPMIGERGVVFEATGV